MAQLEMPFHFPHLRHLDRIEFTPLGHEMGEIVGVFPESPRGRTETVLRVHVGPGDAVEGIGYWDIRSSYLREHLLPLLEGAERSNSRISIEAHGAGRTRKFTVEVTPSEQ